MEIYEAKVVSRTEEQALGLGLLLLPPSPSHPPPSSSSSSSSSSSAPTAAAPVESLTVEFGNLGLGTKLEEKSEGDGMTGKDIEWDATGWNIEPSGWGDEEDDVPERDLLVPSDVGKSELLHYPQRPGQPDCVFYRRAGGCRFGMNCKFNHPPKKKRNRGRSKKPSEATLEGKIVICEVNVVPNEELGLPSSSCSASSSAAAAEALVSEFKNMILEEKSDMKPDRNHDRSYPRSGETSNLKKDSISSKEGKDNGLCFPLRPDKPDCSFYLRTGNCQFGSNCRFNHPPTRKENMVRSKQSEPTQATKGKEKKNTPERVGKTESKKVEKERQNQAHSEKVEHKDREKDFKEKKKETPSGKVGKTEHKDFKERKKEPPSGKVGKTEHKVDKQKQEQTLSGMMGPAEVEAAEEKVTFMERGEKVECKDHSMQEGFKFVEACEHDHVQEKAELGPVHLNFLGLPIRPGERECPYYMRTGGCKFASNCRYHHPDPTAVVGQDSHSGYHPGGSEHAPGGSALPMAPWPFPINSSEPVPFFGVAPSYTPGFFPLPHQGFYQNPEWNGYQVPVTPWFSPEMNMVNIPVSTVHMPDVTVHQQVNIDEYPERPGQPECHFFMKNGECKFKSACRFHHPKSRLQQCA